MKPFIHINAGSVEEAVELLAKYEGKAKLNAGGTDLLGVLKERILLNILKRLSILRPSPALALLKSTKEGLAWVR